MDVHPERRQRRRGGHQQHRGAQRLVQHEVHLRGNADLCDDAFSEQRFTLGENLPEVWFEYYVFMPAGGTTAGPKLYHRSPNCAAQNDPNGVDSNNKFFALWDVDYINRHVRVVASYRRSKVAADGDSFMEGLWCTDTVTWCNTGALWDPAFTDANKGRWVQVRIHAP